MEKNTKASKDFDLQRFIDAQATCYETAIKELKNGRKRTHWCWYIFPQIDGLGHSPKAKYYSIKSIDEAKAYLNHQILGPRLIETCKVVLSLDKDNPLDVFGSPDDLKVKSCMTLFFKASNNEIFVKVLDKYYKGEQDILTINILKKLIFSF